MIIRPPNSAEIAAWIARHNLSQSQAAAALGVSLTTMTAWLGGARQPQGYLSFALAWLDANPDHLPPGRAGNTRPLTNPRAKPPAPKRPRGRPRKAEP